VALHLVKQKEEDKCFGTVNSCQLKTPIL